MTVQPRDGAFTLVETLITLTLLSVGVVAVVLALNYGILSAVDQRAILAGEVAVNQAADHVRGAPIRPCTDAAGYLQGFAPVGVPEALELELAVVDAAEWDGGMHGAVFGACTASSDVDAQRLGLRATVTPPEGRTVTRTVVVVKSRQTGP